MANCPQNLFTYKEGQKLKRQGLEIFTSLFPPQISSRGMTGGNLERFVLEFCDVIYIQKIQKNRQGGHGSDIFTKL